ncbi:MAG TPA: protease modulator HflC [Caulobacteraceae bacterium]|jgi:membrane protease subunit HflC
MKRPWVLGVVAAAVVLILANTFFIVDQRHQAVVVGLGGPVRVINPPGAYGPGLEVKIPFAEWVVMLDRRSLAIDAAQEQVISADQQPLLIDAVVRYRITDPLAFYRTLHDEETAPVRLKTVVVSSLRQALGKESAADIIARIGPDPVAGALGDVHSRLAATPLGVEVADLQIRRVSLPAAGAEAVYQRMTSDVQREAAQKRAQGDADRRDIMAKADNQATVILDSANENAAATRGAGDAQAAQLYAAAYGKDPRFAAFYRTMRAYQNALAQKGTTLVLSPDSDFLKYLRQGPGAR